MSKIVFIEPKAPGLHIFSMFPMPRLGCVILATIARQENWDTAVYVEELEEIDFENVLDADIVGISTITSTAPRAYEIAQQLRAKGKTVLMGGPHVSFMADEAIEHCDFVVRGEGEITLRQFLKAYSNGGDYSQVDSLTYKKDGNVVNNPTISPPVNLSQIPTPDFSLIKSKAGFFKGLTSQKVIPVQTTRGCPYHCIFCSVTEIFGRKVRYRDVEDVIVELRQYTGKDHVIFFYDDNFVVDKARTRRLVERMIEEKLNLEWTAQVRADVAKDPELLRLMRKSGCFMVYVGFETVNQKALDNAEKSQTVEGIASAITEFKKAKIKIHGMFVLGFEEDTYKDAMTTLKFAIKKGISTVQFLILTPIPGSVTFKQMKQEGRILFSDWSLYDGHHVVFKPKLLSVAKLQKAQIKAHAKFYSLLSIVHSICRWKFYKAMIALYAKRIHKTWIKGNRHYLKAIKLLEKATFPFEFKFDIRISVRDVREKIEGAWNSLKAKRLPPIDPQTNP